MKVSIKIILTSVTFFFISSISLAQTDTSKAEYDKLFFNPRIFGGQIEACGIPLGFGFGGVVDVDFFSNNKDKFIGLRFAFEKYEYGSFYGYERGLS